MPADHVCRRNSVLEERPDRVRVKAGDVVALKERIHDQLPVGFHFVRPPRKEMQAAHPERIEIMAERIGFGEIRILAGRKPDQPAGFACGQRPQPIFAFIEVGESFRTR